MSQAAVLEIAEVALLPSGAAAAAVAAIISEEVAAAMHATKAVATLLPTKMSLLAQTFHVQILDCSF